MSVSTRTRFEVFKRDDFTCQYCGRKTPDVVLEIDHIVPRREGGGDEFENLVTACWDCNRGKAGEPLANKRAIVDLEEKARLIQEREQQLTAYNEVVREQRDREAARFDEAWSYWFELQGVTEMAPWHCVKESILRSYLKRFPVEEVKEAMQIAVERHGLRSAAPKYFGGIMRHKTAALEGRLKACTICGGYLILDPGQDVHADWCHTGCYEKREGNDG